MAKASGIKRAAMPREEVPRTYLVPHTMRSFKVPVPVNVFETYEFEMAALVAQIGGRWWTWETASWETRVQGYEVYTEPREMVPPR